MLNTCFVSSVNYSVQYLFDLAFLLCLQRELHFCFNNQHFVLLLFNTRTSGSKKRPSLSETIGRGWFDLFFEFISIFIVRKVIVTDNEAVLG